MSKKLKIKEIFSNLDAAHKDKVKKKVAEEFGVSIDTVKVHWIYNGGTPAKYENQVLEIVKKEAQHHMDEIKSLIDAI